MIKNTSCPRNGSWNGRVALERCPILALSYLGCILLSLKMLISRSVILVARYAVMHITAVS